MTLISKNWWAQAQLRLKATSPVFFKKLRKVAVVIVTLAALVEGGILYIELVHKLAIPDILKYITAGIVGAGASAGITSMLAVHKPEDHGIAEEPKTPVE